MLLALLVGAATAQTPTGEPGPVWLGAVPVVPAEAAAPAPIAPAAPAAAGAVLDRVVAVVNDEVVLLSEVYEFSDFIEEQVAAGENRRVLELQLVERLIERVLVDQEVARLHVEVTDQEVDRAIDDVAQRNGLERDALRAEIEKGGYTWEAYRSELRANLREMKFAQTVLRPRITISEDELRDAFVRANQGVAVDAHVLAIFLGWPEDPAGADAVRARAAQLVGEATAGADFAELSRTNDQGPFGVQGGEMGRFKPGELVGALDGAVIATATGAVTQPIETPQGIFILKVADRGSAAGDFAAVRDQLSEEVYQTRMADEQTRWFQQARRQSAVRIVIEPDSTQAP